MADYALDRGAANPGWGPLWVRLSAGACRIEVSRAPTKPPYSYSVSKNWAGFPIGLWGAGMGVWGKGAAVEPPCLSQHCRDQAAQAARPLPTPVIEIHSHVAIISSRGSPGRITIRWAGLPLRRVKPPDIRCLPSVSRAAGAALFPKRTLRCRPETMTTLL